MDERVWIVAILIGCMGVVGGLAAYLADEKPIDEKRGTALRYLLLGIVAAGCVPLFLSLVRSELIKTMFTLNLNPQGRRYDNYYEAYFIFSGICLIAAFSARRFIDSVSKQVLQRLEQVQETAQGAAATAATARQVAQEAVSEVESVDEQVGAPLPAEVELERLGDTPVEDETILLTPVERRALKAMEKRTYRTRTGIAEDSGISRNQISEVLDALHHKKLAVPTKSPTTGGARWIITRRGEAAVRQSG